MNKYNKLYLAMTDFFAGDVKRIQHFCESTALRKSWVKRRVGRENTGIPGGGRAGT